MENKKNIWIALYLLARSNYSSTVLPAMMVAFSQIYQLRNDISSYESSIRMVGCFIYASLYVFQFNLGNQIIGIEEDRLNKPYRAIPAGRISKEDCVKLYYIVETLYFFSGFYFGIPLETLCWMICSYVHNYSIFGKSGVWKSLLMFPGTVVLISTPLRIANGWNYYEHSPFNYLVWIYLGATCATIMVPIQDLRDVAGDKAIKRETFPIKFGSERTTRFFRFTPLFCIVFSIWFEYFICLIPRSIDNTLFHVIQTICLLSISFYLTMDKDGGKKNVSIAYGVCLLMWFNIYCFFSPILIK